jgi:hypothetical protein
MNRRNIIGLIGADNNGIPHLLGLTVGLAM